MELALGAMAGLAPKLGKLLMEEYVVQKGLKPDIESLARELVTMKAGLEDLSKIPLDQLTEMEKLSARQVRELSYDMEDAIDNFILCVADGGKSATAPDSNIFKKILSKATAAAKKIKHHHQISDKVKDIKKLSKEVAELRTKYTFRSTRVNLAANTGIDPRVLNLYKKESDLVGTKESRDKVIRMLSMEAKDDAHASYQDLKIVSILGVGGLGKTTLAKIVHDMFKKQFSSSAFISVGRTPNLAKTFEKMLVALDKKYKQVDMARWDIEQFVNELHEFLEQKRYFIVVDDIWDVRSWEVIRYALTDNNCGSRIIMTTRNFEIATQAGEVYKLKPLSDENSKKLFYKRIQSQEGESLDCVSGELSSKIIDKCGGIPLAIIAIASLLVERPGEEWPKVYDSIGFGNGDNTTQILSYSYYDLPSYLKPCLLHLSIASKDDILGINSVIWMWIAEGFVRLEEQEGSLYEVGERYFKELVNRSMIEPMVDKYDRFVEQFQIHDIMLDLIHKLATDDNFVTILGSREHHASPGSLRSKKKTSMFHLDNKVRRLALQNRQVQCFLEDTMDMPEVLRSLSILDSNIEIMVPLDSFRVCRVLLIDNCYVPINLKHLGRLLHLKFLGITRTPVDDLPKEIGYLKSLQTLLLGDIGLDVLPSAVCSLTQLMCLTAGGFKRFPTDRIGNLTSIEELCLETVVGRNGTEDLVVAFGKLTRLRVLTVTFSEEVEESLQKGLVQSLCHLQELQELELCSKGLIQKAGTVWEDWEPPMKLRRLLIGIVDFLWLPGWIDRSHLPLLCFLSMGMYAVGVQDLDNLSRLPELKYLDLVGHSWPPWYTVGTDGFRNLRFCSVGTTLKFHMGAMPRLEELHIRVFAGYSNFQVNGLPLEQLPTKEVFEDLDLSLDNLLSLEHVVVTVDCSGATATEVQEVESVVTHAVQNHPNCPTRRMDRVFQENILSDEKREYLHHIEDDFRVLEWKDEPDSRFISYLRWYQLLQKALISIDCAGASICEVEKVEAALRHAAELHPNHPTIQLMRTNTDKKFLSSYHPDTKLMSLTADDFQRFPTDKMGNQIFLEELRLKILVGGSATEHFVVELGKQTRLRVVIIIFDELEESLHQALVQSLCNLQELQELQLCFKRLSQQGASVWEEDWEAPRQLQRLIIVGIISQLPGWINRSQLPLLCFLSLSVYVVEVLDLDNLGRLPELSYLDLYGYNWPPGYTVGTDSFRNLKFCNVGTTLKFHMGSMPRLEELQFVVCAGYWSWEENGAPLEQFPTKDVIEDLDLGLDNLLSLEKVTVGVKCLGATATEVQEVEDMVRRAVENHPNRPTIKMDRTYEKNILSDEHRVALLQKHIGRHCSVLESRDKPDAFFISLLRLHRHLEKAVISIDCAGANMCEVERVEEAYRHAAEAHCNHPTIQLIKINTDKMVSSTDHPDTELDKDHDDSPNNLLCKLQLRN